MKQKIYEQNSQAYLWAKDLIKKTNNKRFLLDVKNIFNTICINGASVYNLLYPDVLHNPNLLQYLPKKFRKFDAIKVEDRSIADYFEIERDGIRKFLEEMPDGFFDALWRFPTNDNEATFIPINVANAACDVKVLATKAAERLMELDNRQLS